MKKISKIHLQNFEDVINGNINREDATQLDLICFEDHKAFYEIAIPIWNIQDKGKEITAVNFYLETKDPELLAKFMEILNEIDRIKGA